MWLVPGLRAQLEQEYGAPDAAAEQAGAGQQEERQAEHGHSGDPLDWLRAAVPGEPGLDYPIYSTPPDTGFTCEDKEAGFYADPVAECQVLQFCDCSGQPCD